MLITGGSIIKLVGPFFLSIYIRMPTINYSVTQSIDTLAVNLSASEALVMNINNPLIGVSYFGLETIPDSNGVYTSASPKNTSGSFTLGTGVLGVVKDDYKMGAVVSPGSNVLTFVPAQAVTGSTLRTRGIAAPPPSTGFDADAEAFFARVTAAGGTLTTTEKNATNQLVLDLKANSLWTPMKAIYPMVGASAAACAQNLKSSSFTGTFSSGWTFSASGVKGDGTSTFMNTNFAPNGNVSLNSTHISYYTNENVKTAAFQMGIYAGGKTMIGARFNSTQNYYGINQSADTLDAETGNVNSFMCLSRISSTQFKYYKTNTIYQTQNVNSTTLSGSNIYLGALNLDNVTVFYPDNARCAFASIGDGLTDTQESNFYTAVQAFQTTLSRQV